MKKLMMMLTGALMWGAAANAQTDFILRGGFATNTFVGSDYDNVDVMPGYNVGLDFNSYIKDGLYWNTGVMFGSRGFKVDYKKADDFEYRAHNIQIPLTVGYKFDMGSGFALDGRIGGFFSADMAGKFGDSKIADLDDYQRCDGGLLIGVGLWYQNLNLDFAYQRGFANIGEDVDGGASNFLIRLGYAF